MAAHPPSFVYDVLILFWRLVINIFFREIRTRGAYNLPKTGPLILVAAPHANQFVDLFILMSEVHRETHRKVEGLIAAKSMERKFIGTFANWMSVIPVARAADNAKLGSGFITISDVDPCLIQGHETRFTSELNVKSQIMLPKSLDFLTAEVTEIISDATLRIKQEFGTGKEVEADRLRLRAAIAQARETGALGLAYKCVPHLDQEAVYRHVHERLRDGGCIGLFPEGGSHDRTDLLPLKGGMAIMALGAMMKDPSIDLKIVPVGLSYFHAHKFRSRAVIEFGSPIEVPLELVELFKQGGASKRQACSKLLELITEGLNNVTLRAPDYETLMVTQAARRLYQIPGQKLTLGQVVELNKRFLRAYSHFKNEPRVQSLREKVLRYNRALRDLGLRDHQVPRAKPTSRKTFGLLCYRLVLLVVWSAFALPGVVLNGPILILVSIISRKKAEEALAESIVKIAGRDVLASWKVLISLVAAPILYSIYVLLVLTILIQADAPLQWRVWTPILALSSLDIKLTAEDRSLRPLVIALFLGQQRRLDRLKQTREELSDELTKLTNELAPTLWSDFNENQTLFPTSSYSSSRLSTIVGRKPGSRTVTA